MWILKPYLHLCFNVERNIVIVKIGTQTQPADVMTKVPQKTKHHFYTRILRNNMTDDDVEEFEKRAYRYDFPPDERELILRTTDESMDEIVKLMLKEYESIAIR